MRGPNLRSVTAYFNPAELDKITTAAAKQKLTVSALIRALFDLPVTTRGAPMGNRNRTPKPTKARPSRKNPRRTGGAQ